ncbi:MAG: right-handed parallel beta-helix repeat-containing protein [Promethearchaeota archaeon]
MSKKIRIKLTILLILLPLATNYLTKISLLENDVEENNSISFLFNREQLNIPRISAIWEEPEIYIDDTDPTRNWSVFAAAGYPWFSGSGIKSDPYEIDNVRVTTGDIAIRNSIAHFRIRNCEGKIYLDNVYNGRLDSNNCSDSFDHGIELKDSNNNLITGNIISNNLQDGLYLLNSQNNTIFGNTVNHNWLYPYHGILIGSDSHDNLIEGNEVNSNGLYGISVYGNNNTVLGNTVERNNRGIYAIGFDNVIVGNIAFNNSKSGIYLFGAGSANITANSVSLNGEYGIYIRSASNVILNNNIGYNNGFSGIIMRDANNIVASENKMNGSGYFLVGTQTSINMDTSNLVNEKPIYFYKNQIGLKPINFTNAGQIILENCTNSLISNLEVSNGTIGICLIDSKNNTIQNVVSSYNKFFGISLSNSNNNSVSGCTTNYNGNGGILLESCQNCNITGSEANSNEILWTLWFDGLGNGINLIESHNNKILGNNVNSNNVSGIFVNFGDENTISGNTADYNGECGILIEGGETGYGLEYCLENNLTDNDVYDNGEYGIRLSYCINSTITENTAVHHQTRINGGITVDQYGILLYSCYFCNVSDNDVSENEVGIVLSGGKYNTLFRNNLMDDLSSNILLSYSHNNTLLENIIDSSTYWGAIELYHSANNTIEKNNVMNGGTALWLEDSNFNNITENYFHDLSANGILLMDSSYNIITKNTIRNCYRCFNEGSGCIGNVFEDNICEGEGYRLPISGFDVIIIITMLLSIVSLVSVYIFFKKRN